MTSDCIAKGKNFIEANPHQAASLSLLLGYLLPFLPVPSLLRVLVRLTIPTLLVMGVVKAFELLRPLRPLGDRSSDLTDNSEPLLDSPPGPSPDENKAS